MVLLIILQWLPMLAIVIIMILNNRHVIRCDFLVENLMSQILTGICIAGTMTALLTVLPMITGLGDMVGSTSYTQTWQFAYEFVYAIIGVALAEEVIFRGYFFNLLLDIKDSKWFAITFSSILFGLYHISSLDPVQIIVTTAIGLFFCVCREKIKYCTILSLIIAHGLYDALLVLWVAIL